MVEEIMKKLTNLIMANIRINIKNNVFYSFLLLVGFSNAANSSIVVKNGFNPITKDEIHVSTNTGSDQGWVYNIYAATYFSITINEMSSQCSSAAVISRLDGYDGVELAPGVLLVIYSSSLQSTSKLTRQPIQTQIATFGAQGAISVNKGYQGSAGKICYDQRSNTPYFETIDLSPVRTISGSLKLGIYVKPGTPKNTLTIPQISVGKINTGGYEVQHNLSLSGQQLSINPGFDSCTISAPATINFGTIPGLGIKENSYIAQQTGNLNINCNSDAPDVTASVKVQVLGATEGYDYILPLRNENNVLSPGEIRGWINRPADQTCSGYGVTTGGLYFGDSSKWYSGGDFKVGNNTIPYVFNLCGSGKNEANNLGRASATATVNISWD